MKEKEMLQILQPLRIPGGWNVVLNDFFMLDPAQYTGMDDEFWHNFVEDMLYIVNERTCKKDKVIYKQKIAIDLGWYLEMDRNGQFSITVIKNDDWICPLDEFTSKGLSEIVDTIEALLKKYSASCYYL